MLHWIDCLVLESTCTWNIWWRITIGSRQSKTQEKKSEGNRVRQKSTEKNKTAFISRKKWWILLVSWLIVRSGCWGFWFRRLFKHVPLHLNNSTGTTYIFNLNMCLKCLPSEGYSNKDWVTLLGVMLKQLHVLCQMQCLELLHLVTCISSSSGCISNICKFCSF